MQDRYRLSFFKAVRAEVSLFKKQRRYTHTHLLCFANVSPFYSRRTGQIMRNTLKSATTYLLAPRLTIFGQPSLSFSRLVHSVQ